MSDKKRHQKNFNPIAPQTRGSFPNDKQPASVKEIFQSYYEYLKVYQPQSHITAQKSKKHIQYFFNLKEITPQDISDYQQRRLHTVRKGAAAQKADQTKVEKELQHCHSAFTRAINAGLTDSNPFE